MSHTRVVQDFGSSSRILRSIYTYRDEVFIDSSDVVVDVGAYIGGFTIVASEMGSLVLAVEPNTRINRILRVNTGSRSNVIISSKAGWKKNEQLEINLSELPNEDSLYAVDQADTNESLTVEGDIVPNIARQKGLESIDFLKIEAEGAEIEILEAALNSDMEIRKVAVDASAERNGHSCVDEVSRILEMNGYTTFVKNDEHWWGEYIAFGILDDMK